MNNEDAKSLRRSRTIIRFAFTFLCLLVVASGQTSLSEETVWKDFTTWIQRQKPNSKPGDLIRSYRESMLRQAVPEDEVSRRMGIVSNFIFRRRPGVELLWDKVYAGKDPIFIQSPSLEFCTFPGFSRAYGVHSPHRWEARNGVE